MRQAAAFPYRRAKGPDGPVEVLLITSSMGRWIIPKGDIDDGMAPHLAAEQEAFEEGGVRGCVGSVRIGTFCSSKEQNGAEIPLEVDVFPLEVTQELDRWPEKDQRERRWLPIERAAQIVHEPDLAAILKSFRP